MRTALALGVALHSRSVVTVNTQFEHTYQLEVFYSPLQALPPPSSSYRLLALSSPHRRP